MAKQKTAYFCQNCGAESAKWVGKCPSCGEWNTYVEEIKAPAAAPVREWRTEAPAGAGREKKQRNAPTRLQEVTFSETPRVDTLDGELNRVLGGGLVPGSLTLIGGEPGIGKSTLMLQVAVHLTTLKILYVSGEESQQQIKMRAERMGLKSEECYLLTETNSQEIFRHVENLKPQLVIIDSIQTLHTNHIESAPGSISQVRETAAEFMKFAKETNTPVFLIGHITKEGSIAGPKVLEHMVDTVLQFEGDRHLSYRLLRTTKNRFGSTAELGIYEMRTDGLRQVSNPSEILLTQRESSLSGMTIGATLEGNRPLLIEVQALVSPAAYGTPQRSATGFDTKRLNMLLAVLEKRGGFRFGLQDVFLNLAGGLRLQDPALDLAICTALVSSLLDIDVDSTVAFAAEVGLGGEIRAVNRLENRIAEAAKLGFKEMFVSRYQLQGLNIKTDGMQLHAVGKIEEVFSTLFG